MQITATKGRVGVCILGVSGMVLLTGGSLFLGLFEAIVRFFLRKELILKEGYEFFEAWRNIPLPTFQKAYLFNITNPVEFERHGSKPIVQELGPYVFKGHWKKDILGWNKTEGTITYRDFKNYTFLPEESVGTQDEIVYTLNGPLLGMINYVEIYAPNFFKPLVIEIVNGIFESYNETLVIRKTVRELLYDGYHEPMVEDLTKMVEPFVTLPVKLLNNTFGLLYERKFLGDGIFTVKSGENGIDDFAEIKTWNGKSSMDWWKGHCNEINGTDGTLFGPGISRNSSLYFFNPNLCRTFKVVYENDSTVHGIPTYRYSFPRDTFASPKTNPENECYCTGHKCDVSGVLPLNTCRKGAPYSISFPHFGEADPELQTAIIGLHPDDQLHKTVIDVEPITGFVLNGIMKLQVNGMVKNFPDYTPLRHVGESIVPIVWMSEEAILDTFYANYFKSRMVIPLAVAKAFCMTTIVIGAVWTVSASVFILCILMKVKHPMHNSFVMKSLQSVYTSVAIWPPTEEEVKESCLDNHHTCL